MSGNVAVIVLAALGIAVLSGAVFYVLGRRSEHRLGEAEGRTARQNAERLIAEATRDAEAAKAGAVLAGKEEVLRARGEWEQHEKTRRDEIIRVERRLDERAANLDRKVTTLEERETETDRREQAMAERSKVLETKEQEVTESIDTYRRRLEQVAGLSAEEARRQILRETEERARSECAALVRDMKEEAKRNGEKEATKLLALAVQRIASDYTSEISVSAVALPNDEMKGRIIGREGRNIRAFETATGVDVIIDDTPDTVVVSCFDPIRREIARLALEQLVSDGRIHPGRIEEVVKKMTDQVDHQLLEAGEQATYELGIHGMHPELVRLVGRMKFRTSYGQNMYHHSKEVAWLSGIMASELKLDVHLAKRGALLHDIGKVLTHQHEGTHVELGVEVAKKYGEHEVVINCIAAHHDDVPHETPISVIVQAADSASGARPGARREALETYVKRLTKLEEIANSFKGVEKTFAIQAGREVRIVVTPDKVSDGEAVTMSEEIARRIEEELQYPGQIKVVVVRETRAVDIAR
ncbi:MAG: ribonuclease Y [Gemmatimonadetes bacterium]|nr:ribonuclease Y [Gemmatimonadota bacterium]